MINTSFLAAMSSINELFLYKSHNRGHMMFELLGNIFSVNDISKKLLFILLVHDNSETMEKYTTNENINRFLEMNFKTRIDKSYTVFYNVDRKEIINNFVLFLNNIYIFYDFIPGRLFFWKSIFDKLDRIMSDSNGHSLLYNLECYILYDMFNDIIDFQKTSFPLMDP